MVTELAPGGNLLRLIDPETPCSLEVASRIITGVFCWLCVIHRFGFAHCDLKPANVLLAEGVPKIDHLGISRFVFGSKRGNTPVGTTAYNAPDLTRRHPFCDEDSDRNLECYSHYLGTSPLAKKH